MQLSFCAALLLVLSPAISSLSMQGTISWGVRKADTQAARGTTPGRVSCLLLLELVYCYCSTRRRVEGGGAGSPHTLQYCAVERFRCPQGHGRNVPDIVMGGTGIPD